MSTVLQPEVESRPRDAVGIAVPWWEESDAENTDVRYERRADAGVELSQGELLFFRRRHLDREFGLVGHDQLQHHRDLALIPAGTLVVPHLINGLPNSPYWVSEFLTSQLGFDPDASVGALGRPFHWDRSCISWAPYTKYVVFDPGDEILTRIRQERTMKLHLYESSGGGAVRINPTRESLSGTWIRVESQPGGTYGMAWATTERAHTAFEAVLPLLPEDDGAEGLVVTADDEQHTSAGDLLAQVRATERPLFVSADLGRYLLTWSAVAYDSEFPSAHEMGLGSRDLEVDIVAPILEATMLGGSRTFVHDVLAKAAAILKSQE